MPDVLLVDDDGDASLSLARALKAGGVEAAIHAATSADQALRLCEARSPAVIVLDLSLDSRRGVESGFELLRLITNKFSHCRSIVLTGHGNFEHGVRALQLGAGSFLEKPASIPHLAALVHDGIRYSDLKSKAVSREIFAVEESLVGTSRRIAETRNLLRFAARTNQSVFLSGETGTGKGVCAQLLHKLSARSAGNFVRYQPSFTSADLVHSDLFGHRKGSFTGATEERRGLVAEADRGTLFLDEVDELPLEFQVTLLGVLQEKRFRPVGSSKEEISDFRLVSASNRPIDAALGRNELRHDLFHRIAQLVIELPALRDRAEDIDPLARHFLKALAAREELALFSIEPDALLELSAYRWPGNVRELQSVVESAAYRASFRGATSISAEDISIRKPASAGMPEPGLPFCDQIEAHKLKLAEAALARCGGNQAQAARELKLDRSTLRRILGRAG